MSDNPHKGSSFGSFLDELGIRAEVEALARVKVNRFRRRAALCNLVRAVLKKVAPPSGNPRAPRSSSGKKAAGYSRQKTRQAPGPTTRVK
ncbi:MAG: hypothetical protein ACHREM_13610, partial [Polyangiales bacterium]